MCRSFRLWTLEVKNASSFSNEVSGGLSSNESVDFFIPNEACDIHVDRNKAESDGTSYKVAKLYVDASKRVTRSSCGRKKNRKEEMLAEFLAVCEGEFDSSSGRSMCKGPVPPKAEEKMKLAVCKPCKNPEEKR
jgi:hypothetical protein